MVSTGYVGILKNKDRPKTRQTNRIHRHQWQVQSTISINVWLKQMNEQNIFIEIEKTKHY